MDRNELTDRCIVPVWEMLCVSRIFQSFSFFLFLYFLCCILIFFSFFHFLLSHRSMSTCTSPVCAYTYSHTSQSLTTLITPSLLFKNPVRILGNGQWWRNPGEDYKAPPSGLPQQAALQHPRGHRRGRQHRVWTPHQIVPKTDCLGRPAAPTGKWGPSSIPQPRQSRTQICFGCGEIRRQRTGPGPT